MQIGLTQPGSMQIGDDVPVGPSPGIPHRAIRFEPLHVLLLRHMRRSSSVSSVPGSHTRSELMTPIFLLVCFCHHAFCFGSLRLLRALPPARPNHGSSRSICSFQTDPVWIPVRVYQPATG